MQAYTYSIKHLPTNKIYYGVRKSTVVDIGINYFSSSKLVKRMISEEPIEHFEFKLRRKFTSYEDARLHESRLLTRLNAVSNAMLLNQAISSPRICHKDSESEIQRRKSISEAMKKVWQDPEYQNNQSFNKLTSEERIARGKAGALKRAENYASGKTKYKDKKIPIYKDIILEKNGIRKTVKANQVPAYSKGGWMRI
jgi:hypothetical protein